MKTNAIQETILENLALYMYLSVSQLQRITGMSSGYLRQQVAILSQRKMIASYHITITAKIRAESIYYLLENGRDVLQEKAFSFSFRLPYKSVIITKDYFHKLHVIDCKIAIREYLIKHNIQLELFLTYFDKAPKTGKFEAAAKIKIGTSGYFIPDSTFIISNGSQQVLFLFEQYEDKHSTRVLSSLGQIASAIAKRAPFEKYGIAANPFVLSVFTHEGIKHAVVKKLQENANFQPFAPYYFFASLSDVINDAGNAWKAIDGSPLMFT